MPMWVCLLLGEGKLFLHTTVNNLLRLRGAGFCSMAQKGLLVIAAALALPLGDIAVRRKGEGEGAGRGFLM